MCGVAVAVLRPTPSAAPSPPELVAPLYQALADRLGAQDQDQEVKEAAILGMAQLVAVLGDAIAKEVRHKRVRGQTKGRLCCGTASCGSANVKALGRLRLLLCVGAYIFECMGGRYV